MPYKPKPIEKAYYSITEVSEMLELTPSLLRFWENQFDSLNPKKGKKGNRMYTPKDIELIKKLQSLIKEKGYTLKGAQMALKRKDLEIEEPSDNLPTEVPQTIEQPMKAVQAKAEEPGLNKVELAEKLVRIRMGLSEIIKQL